MIIVTSLATLASAFLIGYTMTRHVNASKRLHALRRQHAELDRRLERAYYDNVIAFVAASEFDHGVRSGPHMPDGATLALYDRVVAFTSEGDQ